MSRRRVLLIAWLHLVLSILVMGMELDLGHSPFDLPDRFKIAVEEVLGWIVCFPGMVIFTLMEIRVGSGFLFLIVNTFCWCLIVIPIAVGIRYFFRAYLLR